MTKENREKAYKHFRDLEANYTPLPHLDKGITGLVRVRAEAKKSADALLKRNPELVELDKPVEEEKPVEEKGEKPKSKGKK